MPELLTEDGKIADVSIEALEEIFDHFTDFSLQIHMDPYPPKEDKPEFLGMFTAMMEGYCDIKDHDHNYCMNGVKAATEFLGVMHEMPVAVAFDNNHQTAHVFLNFVPNEVQKIMKQYL